VKFKSLLFLIISLIAFFLNPSSTNNNHSKKNLKLMSLEELMDVNIISVSKYKQKISDAPGTVIVISKKQIIERNYFDLSDLLKDVPGIDIVDNARGFGEYYTIRGIEGNDRFLVLINGKKLNPVSGTFLSVGNSISIRYANRVEILFGPVSALYGADAFSGIINIIIEKPQQDLSLKTYAKYGSNNGIDFGFLINKEYSDNFSVNLIARLFKSDGPDFIGKDDVYSVIKDYKLPLINKFEQPIKDHNIFFDLAYNNFTLSFYRQRFNEGNAFCQNPATNIYNKENKWALTTNLFFLKYDFELSSQDKLSAHIGYINHTQDPDTQFFKRKYDNTFNQYLTGKDNTLHFFLTYENKINDKWELVTGLEYEKTESIPPYANDQVLGNSAKYEGDVARAIDEVLTVKETRTAGFLQLAFKPTKKINITSGVRYDYSTRNGGTINPRIGIISKPFKGSTLKFLFGTAFQAPSLFLQYEQWGAEKAVMLSTEELRTLDSSWRLKSQRIKTYEISLSQKFGKNLQLNLSLYHHKLKNLIERVIYTDAAYNKYFSDENNTVYSLGFRNENVGEQNITGFTTSFYTKINDTFNGYIHYSFIDAVAEKSGEEMPIPRIAKNKFWLGFTLKNLFGYFTISPRIKWFGRIYNRNTAVYSNGTQPGYTDCDISIIANNLVKNIKVFAQFNNVFNANIKHGGLFDQIFLLPTSQQPGFQFFIGIAFTK